MANRVYALLVGVNDYAPPIAPLDGCLNDVDLFHAYLRRQVDAAALAVAVLKNGDATRANVIEGFRSHLGQARSGDVALFQFCGHGARWASSAAFRGLSPDGKDEGLVCYDSRRPGGYDLADKELAVLIAETAGNEAHTVVLFDCCHSGSGTRGIDAARGVKPRLTHEVTTERPLESYLDGHYARLRDAGASLFVPRARHILLAACERGQLAQEAPGHGVFTGALLDVLEKAGGDLSYADLFVRCRAAVRAHAFDQDPQFEAYDRFDAGAGFLRPTTRAARGRYLAYCDLGVWTVECGAINGVPLETETPVALALYPEGDPATQAGTARALQVGPHRSEIALDFDSPESARYIAEITSLPAAPLPVAFAGDDTTRSAVQGALTQRGVPVMLVGADAAAGYALKTDGERLVLTAVGRGQEIGFVNVAGTSPAQAVAALAPAVKQVAQWERRLKLQNHRTAMDRTKLELVFVEWPDGDEERVHDAPDVVLSFTKKAGRWRRIRGRFSVRNRAEQTLAVTLVYFSEAYGIHIVGNELVAPGDAWTTVWGDDPRDDFFLADGVAQSLERFKLVVATEKVDDFLLAQPELELGEEYGVTRTGDVDQPPRKVAYANEWFTKDVHIRVMREPA
jgi:hypothetical protein